MRRASRRLLEIAPSATLAVDARANALRAAGAHVISFGVGQPDFPTPAPVVDVAAAACREPRNHQYTPAGGLAELKAAVVAKTERDSGIRYDPSQVLITNGGKHAVFTALASLLDPGDEVLLPAPYWTTYPEAIRLAGGTPVELACPDTTGFKVSVDQLDVAVSDRTKALIFVSPSNPTGVVYTPDETRAIGEWAVANGVWVITDEIYEHLTYGDSVFTSMPAAVPALRDQCLIVNGVAKTYAMTGWRVGWMIGPPDIVQVADGYQSHTTGNIANVSQRAAIAAVEGGLEEVARMREAFARRGAVMHKLLSSIRGVTCVEPQGAFYCFPNVTGLLGRDYGGVTPLTSLELADVALAQTHVAFVPGEAFGAPGYARFSYATSDEAIEEGIGRLVEWATRAAS
ncbi:pyridoxal phosphate-dependent aminotransferase [Desertimonas flava]|uniref:pyridoxal phosphate-dependent aminotransferase n=1 Tax=Desertimonas flava TaxID=2064846 RepID=UPI000E354F8D|nr:pyridoxal phosphate-dependent aminotransferase [Desertimonas flava]